MYIMYRHRLYTYSYNLTCKPRCESSEERTLDGVLATLVALLDASLWRGRRVGTGCPEGGASRGGETAQNQGERIVTSSGSRDSCE